MVTIPLSVSAPPAVHAAPMTGVVFLDPTRVFDSGNGFTNLPAGTQSIPFFGALPNDASQALVQVTAIAGPVSSSGVLMMHSCAVAADPATDVVLPIQSGASAVTNQVYVSIASGTCMTITVPALRVVIDLIGAVAANGGAAYVDIPFELATTVVGPVSNHTIDFSAFGVPSDATGLAVWVDALSTTAGRAVLHPCGIAVLFSQANWIADEPSSSLLAGVASSGAALCIDISDGASVGISIDGYYAVGATATSTSPPQIRYSEEAAPGFVGTSPTRLFDTRSGAPIPGGQVHQLDIGQFVPPETTAVVMNVTVTQPGGSGFVTAYPCDGNQPETSSLNFVAGQTVPNLVTVDAAFQTDICFFASASTHLLADLAGYYVSGAGDGFAPSPPVRMFDTRKSSKVPSNTIFEFNLSPFVASDASSAVFNLTATDVGGPGYVTAYPCGQDPPVASNLNVLAGQTVPNLVTVALPGNKHVCFFTSAATNLIADLAGWYAASASSGFIAIEPTRWADTRDISDVPLEAGSIYFVSFGVDFPDATAMVFNATVTEPTAAGYLTAYPCAPDPPLASNVNFVAGQSVPNMAISATDANGRLCVFNSAPAHWIMDVSGYFTDSLQFVSFFPDGTDVT